VILFVIYLLLTPALLMALARRWRWIDRVSPMTLLYALGLLVSNLTPWLRTPGVGGLNNTLGSVCVPLAIPLMLVSCSIGGWNTRVAAKAFFSGLAAVLATTVAGFFLFRGSDSPVRFAQVSAVAVGIYTGGIPNMGAIAQGVGMDGETYLFITSYDLIVTGLYLLFVIAAGRPVFRRLLPAHPAEAAAAPPPAGQASALPLTKRLLPAVFALAIAIASYLLSSLFPPAASTPVLILLLTTLSIAASFLPAIRKAGQAPLTKGGLTSFDLGLYLVYTFCFSIANACDIRAMNLLGSLNILWYIFFVVFGSLVLQIIIARLIRLDGDSALTASVALINSPPFVPLVAALLGNRGLIIMGITVGMLGYMIGNYLGIGLFYLLSTLP